MPRRSSRETSCGQPLWRGLSAALLLAWAAAATASPAMAPAWSLKTPQGETVHFPEAAQGRPTVLMFWPSWCPFSRALQPYVQDIWQDYLERGVNLWTINIRETGDPVQTLRDRGLSLPLLLDGDPLMHTYAIEYTPWLVVIDGANRIVYTRPRNPPTPIDTAKEVRGVLNRLVGGRAVPIPTTWAKPYDLHLKKPDALASSRLAPAPIAADEWHNWLERYVAGIATGEALAGVPPRGAVADGKTALALARELWIQAYGPELTVSYAPYRALRKDNWWVVLGDGPRGKLGEGLVLVLEADSGRIVRLVRPK
ncbi:MAG TPA: TlpA disulfide reductase family protein [Solimonas sp.]|nr:TlpA disulfide reductase family protein [Solimonas sp.]